MHSVVTLGRCGIGCIMLLVFWCASSFAQFSMGLEFADPAVYQGIPLASTPLMGDLLASVDLSPRFPTPGDQGNQSSCVGWAVAYALKSYQEGVERNWPLTSESSLFSPAFVYNQIRQSVDCNGGTKLMDAFNLLRRDGVALLSEFPYSDQVCSSTPDAATKQRARVFAIADWRRVNVQDETEVKTHIAAGFPVVIGMLIDQPFRELRGPGIYSQFSGTSLGGHALVVVGYDDSRAAFKLINSWGSEWGTDGFGWISYTAFRQAVREGYVAQDIVVQPSPRPSPDPEPRPQPAPTPVPLPPSGQLGVLQITHNMQVNHPAGLVPGLGMVISLPGNVLNASGRTAQLVVRFSFSNGVMLVANPQEPSFRDATGFVATGTQQLSVASSTFSISGFTMAIPYYALNIPPTNGATTYTINAIATLYLDNFVLAQSAPLPFILRW